MGHAADLVLDLEQHCAAVEIDDVLPAILAAIALLGNQVELGQLVMRPGEIPHIDLEVKTVIFGDRLVGLAEVELLLCPDRDLGDLAAAIALDLGRRVEDLAIEFRDAGGGVRRYVKLEVGDAEVDVAE